jgi:hypothetical protein
MPRVPDSLYHPLWDAHPDHILLGILAIAVAGGIWKLLAVAPLPGKLSRWGQKQIPAGECGLTETQTDEASRDFSRTFGEPVATRSLLHITPNSAPLCLTDYLWVASGWGRDGHVKRPTISGTHRRFSIVGQFQCQ